MLVALWKNAAALIAAWWCAGLPGMFDMSTARAEKPNFVIILADDME